MVQKHKPYTEITMNQAKQALLRSGYLLESRVEGFLDKSGYALEANTFYPDPITNKAREIDIYALGAQQLWKEYNFIFPYILIECVNNPQPIAFISKEPQVPFLFHNDLKLSGLPIKILETGTKDSWVMLSDFIHMDKFIHLCKGRVSTQFCSFNIKKGTTDDWMASHEDAHFDSLRKLCDAISHYSDKHFRGWKFDPNELEDVNIQIYYPIIVVQGKLLDVRQTEKTLMISETDHVHFVQSAILRNEEDKYHIDVVTESYFPKLLKTIENEIDTMARRMKRQKDQITRSIEAITKLARKARDENQMVEAMIF